MTYADLRQYCILWGNFHPETKGTVSELVGALPPISVGPARGLLLNLAQYIDEKDSKTSAPRFSVTR